MLIADTRPSSARGVTVWRSVAVLMTHTMGPAPIRKKLDAASHGDGVQMVSSISSAATRPAIGPSTIT